MAIPKKCKAFVVEKAGEKGQIKEIDVPTPKPGEVLVKVHTCGVCHSDTICMDGYGTFPLIPGHEIVGTVVALGDGVTRIKEGDLIGGAWHGGHDGTCRSCSRGLFQCCENELVNGSSRMGGYSEYCTLRAEAAVRLPSGMDKAAMAPLLCAGVTTFNGLRHMQGISGGVVAIQGLGGLGHLAVQYASKMGFRTVALSSSDSKKQFATELGASDYIDGSKVDTAKALQEMGGADIIAITAPNPKLIPQLMSGLAPQGKLLLIALLGEFSTDSTPMITQGWSIHGWPSGHQLDSEEAIAFAQRQGINCMVEKFPLEKAQEALDHMMSGKVRFRSVLVMD